MATHRTKFNATPWLIARCFLRDGEVNYEYMGAAEFEWGAIPDSLKALFSGDMIIREVKVKAWEQDLTLTVIAPLSLDFVQYGGWLQQIADDTLSPLEWTNFKKASAHHLGVTLSSYRLPDTWHDLDYDVVFSFKGKAELLSALSATWLEMRARIEARKAQTAEKSV
jgi:hypothetical protein